EIGKIFQEFSRVFKEFDSLKGRSELLYTGADTNHAPHVIRFQKARDLSVKFSRGKSALEYVRQDYRLARMLFLAFQKVKRNLERLKVRTVTVVDECRSTYAVQHRESHPH